jgi:hypothetical protein
MSKQLANAADVATGAQQAAGEGIPEAVRVDVDASNLPQAAETAAGVPASDLDRFWADVAAYTYKKAISALANERLIQQAFDRGVRLGLGRKYEMSPLDVVRLEADSIGDAQPGVQQKLDQGAELLPFGPGPVEVVDRFHYTTEFVPVEGRGAAAAFNPMPNTIGGGLGDVPASDAEAEEGAENLQFSPAGGGCNCAACTEISDDLLGKIIKGAFARHRRVIDKVPERADVVPHGFGPQTPDAALPQEFRGCVGNFSLDFRFYPGGTILKRSEPILRRPPIPGS